jgi:outer membrane autotransporter protein
MGRKVPLRAGPSPWDVWVEGRYARFSDDRSNTDSDGYFGVLYAGTDLVLRPWLLVGALVQYDTMKQSSQVSAFEIDAKGWMAGPYATVQLGPNLYLQARAAAGTSSNSVSPFLTYTDEFSSRRWLASTTLVGRWQYGAWLFRPSASLAFVHDESQSYVDGAGATIPSLTSTLGQAKIGPEVAYRFAWRDGIAVEPHAGMQAIWNFASSGDAASFGGTLAGPEGLRGKAEVGIKVTLVDGIVAHVTTSYDGIGSTAYHAIEATAGIRLPLR